MASDPTQQHASFYISWKHIRPRPQHTGRPNFWRRTSMQTPPVLKDAFECSNRSPTYVWYPGVLRELPQEDRKHMRGYRTSSVCWRPDHGTYLTVPYDCTQESVRDKVRADILNDWDRLKFNPEQINGRHVSVLGHRYGSDFLAAEGPPTYVPELIPQIHQRHDLPTNPNGHGRSLLAGDISILMGLALLSNTDKLVVQTIQRSFRPPGQSTWVPHGMVDSARQEERGVVVYIYTDDRYPKMRPDLAKWENGKEMAILA